MKNNPTNFSKAILARLRIKRIGVEGMQMPRGYAVAYCDFVRCQLILYPFPLNHVVATWRNFWFKVRNVSIGDREWQALQRITEGLKLLQRVEQIKKEV